jgi:XTP/dITP diphosphohydrolase
MYVLATKNPNKLEELRSVLADVGVELRSAFDFAELTDVDEDADTLEGNALKKARYSYGMTNLPSISDDTGLEVESLNGAPGVFSARYAGEKATYQDNVIKLLDELHQAEGKGVSNRKAQFRTVIALVTSEGEWFFEGVCAGVITREQRGAKGFGYDPVFVPDGFEITFAEMSAEEKNRVSHRGKAVAKLKDFLKR